MFITEYATKNRQTPAGSERDLLLRKYRNDLFICINNK